MDNPEEVLHCLDEFAKLKPKDIPRELEDYLMYVARTGDPVYQWPVVKCLFREKLLNVITEFYETSPSCDIPQCPNVDPFNYETMKSVLLDRLEAFSNAPFTVQRLCELLTTPRKEYNRPDKFMRAIEKNILVVSTREPGGACRPDSALSEPLPNGLSESVEPSAHQELHSNISKETVGNHVSSIPSDESSSTSVEESNLVESEKSELSVQDNDASDVKVDVEANDNGKSDDSVREESLNQTDDPILTTESAATEKEEVETEKPCTESPHSKVGDESSEPIEESDSNDEISPPPLPSTESVSTSKDGDKVSEEVLPTPSEEDTVVSKPSENGENAPNVTLSSSNVIEAKQPESEEKSSPTKSEASAEPLTDQEGVSESNLEESGVMEQPTHQLSDTDLPSQSNVVEESEKISVEKAEAETSLELAADTQSAASDVEEKSASERANVEIVQSVSETVNNDNIEIETNLTVSEEAISLEEAMDVDESSNQLADSEAMAVAEEGEPMDDSDQSPTEEMTVCPQLPSQE